jgi:Sulfotransferase family
VIGAKAGEQTTVRLGRDPSELKQLRRVVGAPVKLLHVVRNPFDTIARMALITKAGTPERTVVGATDFMRRLARINDRLITEEKADVLTIRHESFVRDPQAQLRRICGFLDIESDDAWLVACASVVFETPKQSLELVAWMDEERAAVDKIIAKRAYLAGYSWTSDE